jgi:hypothetical protein
MHWQNATETIGLHHNIQCWHDQAHKVSCSAQIRLWTITEFVNPVPSVQLQGHRSVDVAWTVRSRSYIFSTEQQSKYLGMMLKKFAPTEYALLKRPADAGRWYTDTEESCTLGLCTIWKLQVGLHLDPSDWELCIITCGGTFNGGRLSLPDLNLYLVWVIFI